MNLYSYICALKTHLPSYIHNIYVLLVGPTPIGIVSETHSTVVSRIENVIYGSPWISMTIGAFVY